jgi:outer membrane lipoprotein carrier protein
LLPSALLLLLLSTSCRVVGQVCNLQRVFNPLGRVETRPSAGCKPARRIQSCPTILLLLALLRLPAADLDVPRTLKGVEDHYNRAKTIQVTFAETYTAQGRKRTESGELYLRKPGRMRWQYTNPAGKLYVSDNKFVYSLSLEEKRAEKMTLKAADDLKAPLAFLLGHLQFNDDFKEFRARSEDGGVYITAIPKSDKMPYAEVAFLAGPDFAIHHLIVTGQDHSLLEFFFTNEKVNPPIADAMFQFKPPPGIEYVDLTNQ